MLGSICHQYIRSEETLIDFEQWNRGRFWPIPPIIDAAVALYSGMDVFEIGHARAAGETLDETTNTLVQSVLDARSRQQKMKSTSPIQSIGRSALEEDFERGDEKGCGIGKRLYSER